MKLFDLLMCSSCLILILLSDSAKDKKLLALVVLEAVESLLVDEERRSAPFLPKGRCWPTCGFLAWHA